ncbi:MAG: hypothetical protein H6736_09250 [Alphaproteobacteria bacterium]|nr:hypothetical protein [Alphaproteobacteria bacterium]MCB9691987.1 hypothetical protein [Alphaproteobacteria bacterium]
MPVFDASSGTCEIFTYKAGLLSAVGHDLLFRVKRWSLTVEDDHIEGTFDGTSFEVVGAIKDGRVAPGALSAKDERDILANIDKHVFKGFRPRDIRFEADDVDVDDDCIEGTGTLAIPPGRHDVRFEAHIEGGKATCRLTLHQPDWGITPFKALMGTLKIKPDIKVRITVPWDG